MERYQKGALNSMLTSKDELNATLREQLFIQRENHRLTREQLSLVTRLLLTISKSSDSDEATTTLHHAYRNQMGEFDRLRLELDA